MGQPLKIGIVGVGMISSQYLKTIASRPELELTAVADLDVARARQVASNYSGVQALTVNELLASEDVDTVLNLTIPAAHADIALAAIAQGKNVYGEKPFTATTEQGREVIAAAESAGVRLGCAPDTVLGTGIQTARHAIDSGKIGQVVSATAIWMAPGHEAWHPNPDFYYTEGGGPLLDMGPYYVAALVTLLGPVTSVIASSSMTRSTRIIGSGPRAGESFPVEVDTHVSGVMTHASGALSTILVSFDGVATKASRIEVHGIEGSLTVPDPNFFVGDVQLRTQTSNEWETLPVSAGYRDGGRGIGLVDLALTPQGQEPRAGAAMAFHSLEVMESLLHSAKIAKSVEISSTCQRPAIVELS